MLMTAVLGSEGITSSNSFVWLLRNTTKFTQQLAGCKQMRTYNTGFVGIAVGANPHGHDNFFERRVAGALADAIDCALHLARACGDCGQGVGHGKTQIVVTGGWDRYFLDSPPPPAVGSDPSSELVVHADV